MVRAALLAALGAGVVAGLVLFGLQCVATLPLIAEAEVYEATTRGAASAGATEGATEGATRRDLVTAGADVLASFGFALLLVAAFAWRGVGGWRSGLAWGLAGYASVSLAPALGLPPALPGGAETALGERQAWWLLTAGATAAGLWLVAFAPPAAKALGLVLLVVPHVLGAPEAGAAGVPDELRVRLIAAVLLTSLVHWLVLGGLAAWLFARLGAPNDTSPG